MRGGEKKKGRELKGNEKEKRDLCAVSREERRGRSRLWRREENENYISSRAEKRSRQKREKNRKKKRLYRRTTEKLSILEEEAA